ncbi:MAG: CoA transferase [Proteobacteria bacterium]|nr:CoA transferase [Pseudomonadota bacterium]
MSRPLSGILVVALEQAVAAPFATARLADAGARVIKVERPGGDFARGYDAVIDGLSSFFVWLNRGKESCVLDIKDPSDAALLQRILARADVFVQNLAPGAAARAGFGSEALRRECPRLVTCDISGYGEGGPYRDMKAYDLLVQAESGLAAVTGGPEEPGRVGISVCDISCGASAHAGILEALFERERTGRARGIALSLFHTMTDWMNVPILQLVHGGKAPPRIGLTHPSIAPYGVYAAGDGEKLLIGIQNEREWASFCARVLERPELAKAEPFASNVARVANRPALDREIADVFGRLTRAALVERLNAASIAYGAVNPVEAVARHPQLRRTRVATAKGPVEIVAPALQWKDEEPSLGAVPALGEHTEKIRHEFAT